MKKYKIKARDYSIIESFFLNEESFKIFEKFKTMMLEP